MLAHNRSVGPSAAGTPVRAQEDPVPITAPPRRATRAAAVLTTAVLTTAGLAGCTASGSGSAAPPSTAGPSSGTSPSGAPSADALQDAYQRVIRQVLPSVVQITTGTALGSGIVLDGKGDVVTNAHVVGDATTFSVTYSTSTTPHPATLVGTYGPDDLAVIRVQDPPKVQPATFADSGKVSVGTIVLAMGNPLGLSSSVTNGIVSAVGRTVSEGDQGPGATLPDAIQTSAAINPGNSGGALVDLQGRVIGIPTLAAVDPELGGSAAPGIGFAIPSDVVTDIAGQLVADGHVTHSHRAALGAAVVPVTDAQGQPAGVGVVSVDPGGPAATAGIQAGDVLTSVAGKPVHTTQQLAGVLAGLDVGQTVPVAVVTGGGQRTVQVTLGQLAGS
jgi:putative serine protease PepD